MPLTKDQIEALLQLAVPIILLTWIVLHFTHGTLVAIFGKAESAVLDDEEALRDEFACAAMHAILHSTSDPTDRWSVAAAAVAIAVIGASCSPKWSGTNSVE